MFRGYSAVYQRIRPDEFYSQFRKLCKEYSKGFPCENLSFCVRQFEDVLRHNRKTIDDSMVMDIFQIMLEEFRDECVRRIEEFGRFCPR